MFILEIGLPVGSAFADHRVNTGANSPSCSAIAEPTSLQNDYGSVKNNENRYGSRMSLENKIEELAKCRQELIEIYRFIGRLEQSLVTTSYSEAESDISIQIDKLGKRIVELEDKLDIHSERQRFEDSLQQVAMGISRYSEMLDFERKADPVRLDIKELTLRISSGKREDFLWGIGSGKNHMGLHVSSLLS